MLKDQTLFPLIFIPNKYTHEVRINASAMSKHLKFHDFIVLFCFGRNVRKKWEKKKIIHHDESVHVGFLYSFTSENGGKPCRVSSSCKT